MTADGKSDVDQEVMIRRHTLVTGATAIPPFPGYGCTLMLRSRLSRSPIVARSLDTKDVAI